MDSGGETNGRVEARISSGCSNPSTTHGLDEIERTVALVKRIDELVDKRKSLSRAPPAAQQIFSDDNVDALFRRVEIWERAARSPTPPR